MTSLIMTVALIALYVLSGIITSLCVLMNHLKQPKLSPMAGVEVALGMFLPFMAWVYCGTFVLDLSLNKLHALYHEKYINHTV